MKRDAVLPALLASIGTIESIARGHRPLGIALATFWLACAVLVARRAAPVWMPVTVAALYAAAPLLGFDVSDSAAWVLVIPSACFSAGLHAAPSRRIAALVSVVAALVIAMAGLKWLTDFAPDAFFGVILSIGPWGLGVLLRGAIERNRRLGADAERARIERAAAARRAAAAERHRVADELHDVLAHTLAAMVVQASLAGERLARGLPATDVLRRVEQAGREALAETGRLLRVMRHEELPAVTVDADKAPVRAPAPRADIVLPALFAAVGVVEIAAGRYSPVLPNVAAFCVAAAALSFRRRIPLAMPPAVAAIDAASAALGANTDDPASWVLLYGLACHAAGANVPRARAPLGFAVVLVSIVLVLVDPAVVDRISWDAMFVLAFAVAPWAIGVALRVAYEDGAALAADAEETRVGHEEAVRRAAAHERRRIARELHDVLSSGLSVMVVQEALAAELAATGSAQAEVAARAAERAGRTALAQSGRLLARLRNEAADAHPMRGVADLRALADDYERAGLGVQLDVGDLESLPAGVDVSTFRIVQEGLTNALKHAPGSPVQVRLVRRPAEVAIEVRNGRGASAHREPIPGGHGLLGLRERVTLLGGRFDARETADGGFVLAASLPVDGAPT